MSDAHVDRAVHAPRRTPSVPEEPVHLDAIADALLDRAAVLDTGRAAGTLTPGAGAPLKQTFSR